MKKAVVTYQIGVDILGFPIYIEHHIYTDKPTESKNDKSKQWINVIEKQIKQH
ncbi:hypothetical protein HX004_14075 [Myroides sp. 1354]|uniref:hypothetical protein n=1 Tax=unclassified Myroides TaxID=2642485 RepID=UPI002574C5EC|nr:MULTISPECIES: hypothetical protein [unclassified Myroides]MDM1045882.1 hypothetical protein [Myroides sp. R163-1]MDM1056892.1 hypothetical protein [Myroides sp. 1354]MDM1070087.1 hypothetical protein [Myroides sp. 1372]